jgi:hypothetical protein
MTRDEYLHVLATEPATSTQVGAIIGEFDRLGITGRAERLAISAELLGLDGLDSTADLTQGQAGYLVNLLRRTRDRTGLPGITAAGDDEDQAAEHDSRDLADDGQDGGERITWPEVINRIVIMLYAARWGKGIPGD